MRCGGICWLESGDAWWVLEGSLAVVLLSELEQLLKSTH